MVLYEVTLETNPELAGEVERHMRQDHIPEIFATACFQRIHFESGSGATFRTSYQAETQADLDRYLREHAPRLRAAFQAHFPSGITISRQTWSVLERWE
jgi:Domain of unknown function (DUF4286)